MHIRAATESDIPAIVNLLKVSLGEGLMPKSEDYWRWKHLNNPFGQSSVLLCWEGDILVGVRAFMRWEWVGNGQVYKAVRAVDTATHPDHQGRGIFKKLTLSLVETCKLNGDEFVFNTPNEKSKPGYLKMGWKENGKLPVMLGLHRPLNMARRMLSGITLQNELSIEGRSMEQYVDHKDIQSLISKGRTKDIVTKVSVPYLKWRYCAVPVATYFAIPLEEKDRLRGLVICRVKESRIGRELRITDCFATDKTAEKQLALRFKTKVKDWKIDFCTISSLGSPGLKQLVGNLRWKVTGPIVTIRSLSLSDLSILQQFKQWAPSTGDLELF